MDMIPLTDKVKPLSVRPRKKPHVWRQRILPGLLIALVAFFAISITNQAIGLQADKRNFPPPGQMYDIGGYRLHLYCTGPLATGNPTVILETFAGGTSADWAWIQPEVAKVTRVCSYDRAGRGWSSPSLRPVTLHNTVDDLHRLLQKAGVAGPYVMVGHSIGGIYVRQYADDYPNEVVGIVLMDSSHPDQLARVPAMRRAMPRETRLDATLPTLARLGIWRLYFAAGGKLDFDDLPPRQFAEATAFWSSPENLASLYAETAAIPAILVDAHPLGGLGSLPLAVVTHGAEPPEDLVEMQNELAGLSSNSIHITVPGATHLSLALNPKHASFTSRTILQVIQAVRTSQRLAVK